MQVNFLASVLEDVKVSIFLIDFTSMCVQTVFTALDHLTAWASAKNKAYALRKSKGLPIKGQI